MNDTDPRLATVRGFLSALEQGATGEALARFFTDDVQQVELPNRLNPAGARSDRATLLRRSEQATGLLQRQRYEVVSEAVCGERVVVEAVWTATLAVPLASLPAGGEMKAHFAMFFTLQGGRIREMRNYDCFEPF